jgi:hypothetical protein
MEENLEVGSKYLTVGVAENVTDHVPVLFVHGVKCEVVFSFGFWLERGLSERAVLNKRIGFLKYLLSESLVSSGGRLGETNCTSFGLGRLSFFNNRTSLQHLQLELVGES